VDRIINAFEIGYLKMRPEYWPTCRQVIGFDPGRTLYVDDDEACLDAARRYGVRFVYHSSKSSSQLPPQSSARFTSIENLRALLTR
jgi:putative hydrolase of the HAD superfamily